VWGGITASPEKATKINQTIVVTVTVPAECEFAGGAWTGPGGLSGGLSVGENHITASRYSKILKDYIFIATFKKTGEDPWNEKAFATLYRHWSVVLYGKLIMGKRGSRWSFHIIGLASPKGALITGQVTAGGILHKASKVLKGNLYRLAIPSFENLNPPIPLKVAAVSAVDGVLPRSVNIVVKKAKIKVPML
jgi:hypothetical protein